MLDLRGGAKVGVWDLKRSQTLIQTPNRPSGRMRTKIQQKLDLSTIIQLLLDLK